MEVTLRTPLGQAPVIMLLVTVDNAILGSSGPGLSNISISFEVGLNGRMSVIDLTGLLEESNPETQDGQENELLELQKKMSRVLETSQDIGILVEWVLRWKRQRS